MEHVRWNLLLPFYHEAWDTMPFESILDAQLFINFLVSWARYVLARLIMPDITITLDILEAQIVSETAELSFAF
jgi:hypothetical protein